MKFRHSWHITQPPFFQPPLSASVGSSAHPPSTRLPASNATGLCTDNPVNIGADSLPDADLDDDNVAWLNVTEMDELAQCVNACVERWRAAGPEARKKMFALFAIAGIFLAVCRHGHVLVMCDMIRSREL